MTKKDMVMEFIYGMVAFGVFAAVFSYALTTI